MYDLAIVGGGPAGLTAAVYAARKKLKTLLISKDLGGQVNLNARIENYMGYQFIEGFELMQKFEEQVKQFPINLVEGKTIERVVKSDEKFDIAAEDGSSYKARAVIVATGKRPRQLNVPGEIELLGKGVTYCAVCDGPLFAGKTVAVVGGGNSALETAVDMIKIAESVYLISITDLSGDPILIERVTYASNITLLQHYKVLEIRGDKSVTGITVQNIKTGESKNLEVSGILVEIGLTPNSALVRDLTQLNDLGEIMVTCANETGVAGLFAAGDVTNVPEKQIVVSAGEGAKSALRAHRYLQRLAI